MKKLLIAAMIGLTQVGGARAQPVPQKFQGDWVRIDQPQDRGHMKVDAKTIDFGGGLKETLSSVEPGSDDDTTMLVKYRNVEWVWYLTKINGREILIWVNAESPTSIMVTQRAR
jgi:hypothetical protein